jgi:2-isopropylmalate synthase
MSIKNNSSKRKIYLYDTTLRDGSQREGISFTLLDKLKITEALDELGIDYLEGGWPLSNPKDEEYFQEVKKIPLKNIRLVAFGSTRRKGTSAEKDENLNSLLKAETETICIFGKSWDLHVRYALRTSFEENLRMINESVKYLKERDREVIFDAEHFFDGYKSNPKYALKTIEAAIEAGADWIVLCDTNGGTLPHEIHAIVSEVIKIFPPSSYRYGIHAHNDSDTAVANSLMAVLAGVDQVHGTINGYGERCGNANLCSIIPALKLKLNFKCISLNQLKKLTEISNLVAELANQTPTPWQPYVGSAAFTHKGGVHVSAVKAKASTYEHVPPSLVGNMRRIVVSELAGKSTIILKAQELGLNELKNKDELIEKILKKIKKLEKIGYHFEAADGSFELLVRSELGLRRDFFRLESYRVIVEKREDGSLVTEATIKLYINGERYIVTEEGNGPVNALDRALRKALEKAYPELKNIQLTDYKVRVLQEKQGTAAVVRVLIESSDGIKTWGTIGVSPNIIEASWDALVESITYGLLKKLEEKQG